MLASIASAIFGLAKPASRACSSVAGSGAMGPSLSASASAISAACRGTTTAEALMQLRPPLSAIVEAIRVNELRPALDLVLADEDFAVARPVNLNGGIAGVGGRGAFVAENQGAPAAAQNLGRAFVIGGIKAERLRRATGRDEGLDQAEGRPRLLAARLDDRPGFSAGWPAARAN